MSRTIAISDIHGQFDVLSTALRELRVNIEKDHILLLGDYIDRGPHSKECLQFAKFLNESGAMTLKGNHEELLLGWLDHPDDELHTQSFYLNGGIETIKSFLPEASGKESSRELALRMLSSYPEEIAWVRNLPYFFETITHFFVHAGVNLHLDDIRQSEYEDYLWSRESFWEVANKTDKHIVFGHTPSGLVRQFFGGSPNDFSIYTLPCNTRTVIDGGAGAGKQLNVLVLEEGKQQHHSFPAYTAVNK